MSDQPIHIAIETSSRRGSAAVGRGEDLLEAVDLQSNRRHAVELLPMLDRLSQRHLFSPSQIGQVTVSIGPGSFTGLRIGVTVAKMLARTVGCKVVAVPTLDVVARNSPTDQRDFAICLNAKSGRCFTGFYHRESGEVQRISEPALLTPRQIVEQGPAEFAILGDHLPEYDWPESVRLLDEKLAVPNALVVWQLGQAAAAADDYVDPIQLVPLYVRLPEAEEKWLERQGT